MLDTHAVLVSGEYQASSCAAVNAGPAPRKLSFGGSKRAAKKKRLVLEDSDDEETAAMADADSGEDSGSIFEAQEADASSSEDETDSVADASDEVQHCSLFSGT